MKTTRLTAWIALTWIGAVAFLGTQPTLAQTAPSGAVGSLQEDMQRSEGDFFPNSTSTSSIYEIINRVQMINSPVSPSANIDDAAAKFRAQQQQQLQGQNQPLSPDAPVQVVPAPVQ